MKRISRHAHMTRKPAHATVDAYLAAAEPGARRVLRKIRSIVASAVPDAQQIISYQMPAFKLRRVFFCYAAFTSHIGIYPPVKGSDALEKALQPYRGPKGNLKFPLDQPLPYALIKRVAMALKRQHTR